MSTHTRPDEEPALFDDLPLRPEGPKPRPRPPTVQHEAPTTPEPLSLFTDKPEKELSSTTPESVADGVTRPVWRPPVPIQAQLSASLLDLGVMLAVGVLIWLGLRGIGIELDSRRLGFLVLFFLPFSFLYQVFPLAFWGRTPGMARVGLVARGGDGQSLTFSQAGLRWVASVLTVVLLGLPLLTTPLSGRSLADRLSDSETLPAR